MLAAVAVAERAAAAAAAAAALELRAVILVQRRFRTWRFRREVKALVRRERTRREKEVVWRQQQQRIEVRAVVEARKVVTEVRDAAQLSGVSKTLQGDLNLYTEANIDKRMRLRHHPDIVAAIDRWWACLPASNRDKRVTKESKRIDKAAYMELNFLIQASPLELSRRVEGWTRCAGSPEGLFRARPEAGPLTLAASLSPFSLPGSSRSTPI